MEQDSNIQHEEVAASVQKVVQKINAVISSVREIIDTEENPSVFFEQNLNKLAIIGAYVELFTSLKVGTRREAERLWQDVAQQDDSVEDAVLSLIEVETEFDKFLAEVERVLYPSDRATKTTTDELKETKMTSGFEEIATGKTCPIPSVGDHMSVKRLPLRAQVKTTSGETVEIGTLIPPNGSTILVFLRHFG